jgi:hypothetical protein
MPCRFQGLAQAEALRDPRFYLLLPALLASGFINIGVFFHQIALVEDKD